MKRRVVRKVEKMMLVDKLCQLQQDIDEHLRFEKDLLVMLLKRDPEMTVIMHGDRNDYFEIIWRKVVELLRENNSMARDLKEKAEKK